MGNDLSRLDIRIDIFEETGQRAQVLPTLTPPEFIQAILEEFGEMEQLGGSPSDYSLSRLHSGSLLDETKTLSQQLRSEDHLVLVEKEQPRPAGTQRPAQALYLREQTSGKVYKLHWLPAIIGRPDPTQPHAAWLAVDLHAQEGGLRVSRRHAMISIENGNYYIEALSKNPIALERENGSQTIPVEDRERLEAGDLIRLSRSKISLKFIVLDQLPK